MVINANIKRWIVALSSLNRREIKDLTKKEREILTESVALCGERNFFDLVKGTSKNSLLCVGFDTDYEKIPMSVIERAKGYVTEVLGMILPSHERDRRIMEEAMFLFNCDIIEAVVSFSGAFKFNAGFYGEIGSPGNSALERSIAFVKKYYSHIPIIVDGKRGDIANSNEKYANEMFRQLGGDAATINPYVGGLTLEPFFRNKNKAAIVIAKTSNEGSEEFQDRMVLPPGETDISKCMPLYLYVALRFCNEWNIKGNCALVVGATYPEQLKKVREAIGNMLLLIPGVGKQGGDLEKTVKYGLDAEDGGILINASRSIIFASAGKDFAQAAAAEAERMNNEINAYRIRFSRKVAASC